MTEDAVITISEEQVSAAEAAVTEAERVRAVAEEALMEAPHSTVKSQELASALKRVAQCRADARELGERRAQQLAEARTAATREQLEKAAAKEITAAGRELKAARAQLEEAAEAAQRGLVELMKAADAYDVVVQRRAEALAAQGLDMGGESGGASRLTGWAVRARGAVYESAGSGAVLACVAHRVAAARLPYPNYMVGVLQYNVGRVVPEERSDGLLAGLSAPERLEWPEVPRLKSALQR